MARQRKGQGAKGPGSELAGVLLADSLLRANLPGSEKARYPGAMATNTGRRSLNVSCSSTMFHVHLIRIFNFFSGSFLRILFIKSKNTKN